MYSAGSFLDPVIHIIQLNLVYQPWVKVTAALWNPDVWKALSKYVLLICVPLSSNSTQFPRPQFHDDLQTQKIMFIHALGGLIRPTVPGSPYFLPNTWVRQPGSRGNKYF
jgi:hypothetical protein